MKIPNEISRILQIKVEAAIYHYIELNHDEYLANFHTTGEGRFSIGVETIDNSQFDRLIKIENIDKKYSRHIVLELRKR